MMKINTPFLMIAFALCVNISMINCMEQIKTNIKNILNTDITKDVIPQKMNYCIQASFKKRYSYTVALHDIQNQKIATCSFYPTKNIVCMQELELTKEYRNKGIGEQFFYLCMYTIKQEYPDNPQVEWLSVSDDDNDQPLLNKFYLRVGAQKTYQQDDHSFHINLKDAGYHDEN